MNWFSRLFGTDGAGSASLTSAQKARLDAWRKLPPPDAARSHFQTRYIVADVETSGLNMIKDHLISIGAVGVSNGMINPLDAFEVVLRQDIVSTHDNILIHGIGGSAQRDGVEPADALLLFLEYVGKSPLVAYHAEFDQRFIARAMKRFLGAHVELQWIDIAWVLPEIFRERIDAQVALDDWLQQFDIENIQRHNAVSDAYATAKLLQVAITQGASIGKDSAQAFVETVHARRTLRRA